jgi:hypothetical protein
MEGAVVSLMTTSHQFIEYTSECPLQFWHAIDGTFEWLACACFAGLTDEQTTRVGRSGEMTTFLSTLTLLSSPSWKQNTFRICVIAFVCSSIQSTWKLREWCNTNWEILYSRN